MKRNLKEALTARREAERRVELELAIAYPKGSRIEWLVGEHQQSGHVVRHGLDRVRVFNSHTERESWIYAARIL